MRTELQDTGNVSKNARKVRSKPGIRSESRWKDLADRRNEKIVSEGRQSAARSPHSPRTQMRLEKLAETQELSENNIYDKGEMLRYWRICSIIYSAEIQARPSSALSVCPILPE